MSVILLTPKSELQSAKGLGYECFTYPPKYDHTGDLIIRWGSSIDVGGSPVEIGSKEHIRFNVNKLDASKLLIKNNISVPKVYENKIPRGKICVVRKTEHTEGKDFKVIKGPCKLEKGYYAAEFIKSQNEYRVYYCNNFTLTARRITYSKKLEKQRYKNKSMWGLYFWSRETPKDLHDLVCNAFQSLGLQLGVADVIVKDGKYYILECNGAPSLYWSYPISFFKKGLKELIKKKQKELKKYKVKPIYLHDIWLENS